MATIEDNICENWLDLSSCVDEYFTHYNNYIFRGQADANWKLESTLARSLSVKYKKTAEKKNATKQHFNQFKENIRGRSYLDLRNSTEDEIWALGQHFGLNPRNSNLTTSCLALRL